MHDDRDKKPSVSRRPEAAARAPTRRRRPRPATNAQPGDDPEAREEELLDEAVQETFPASDPISPATPPPTAATIEAGPPGRGAAASHAGAARTCP